MVTDRTPAGQSEMGVNFPRAGSGRSTSALGRAVVADALRAVSDAA